jgi:hypothetical protein
MIKDTIGTSIPNLAFYKISKVVSMISLYPLMFFDLEHTANSCSPQL